VSILVASDLTYRSDRALARGIALAREMSTPLHVLHVVDETLPEQARTHALDYARHMLTQACASIPAGMAPPTIAVEPGHPKHDVARYAVEAAAQLIVVGLHDAGKDSLFNFADTTAGHIVRSSPLPILLVTHDVAGPYRSAVIGVDFSVYAKAAIRNAMVFAPQAKLHLVHAYRVPFRISLGSPEYLAELRADAARNFDAFLKDEMAVLVKRTHAIGVAPDALHHEVQEGMPYEVLARTVERVNADLIVVGTHGSSGFARAVWGSVVTALLEAPPTDVLIVHAFS
jgi:nucleotide-binding universal stress UspA family protein